MLTIAYNTKIKIFIYVIKKVDKCWTSIQIIYRLRRTTTSHTNKIGHTQIIPRQYNTISITANKREGYQQQYPIINNWNTLYGFKTKMRVLKSLEYTQFQPLRFLQTNKKKIFPASQFNDVTTSIGNVLQMCVQDISSK